jgi:Sodium/hydrogen exchanger family
METTGILLILRLSVMISGVVARVTPVPVPLVQIVLGAAILYFDLTSEALDPAVFFLLFLPPLLFLDGCIPKDSQFRDASTITTATHHPTDRTPRFIRKYLFLNNKSSDTEVWCSLRPAGAGVAQ